MTESSAVPLEEEQEDDNDVDDDRLFISFSLAPNAVCFTFGSSNWNMNPMVLVAPDDSTYISVI